MAFHLLKRELQRHSPSMNFEATTAALDHTLQKAAAALRRASILLREAAPAIMVPRYRESPLASIPNEACAATVGDAARKALKHTESAERFHFYAASQVDAALEELDQLRSELEPILARTAARA